jgi:hypothetical protein
VTSEQLRAAAHAAVDAGVAVLREGRGEPLARIGKAAKDFLTEVDLASEAAMKAALAASTPDVGFWEEGGFGDPDRLGEFRCLLTHANGQPAVANYLRAPGSDTFVALAIDVLTIADGEIVEIVTFGDSRFASFGLAAAL